MNRLDVLEAIMAADEAMSRRELWGFGPNGFGPYPPEVLHPPQTPDPRPIKKRWTGKPRRNSKQGRRERGEY